MMQLYRPVGNYCCPAARMESKTKLRRCVLHDKRKTLCKDKTKGIIRIEPQRSVSDSHWNINNAVIKLINKTFSSMWSNLIEVWACAPFNIFENIAELFRTEKKIQVWRIRNTIERYILRMKINQYFLFSANSSMCAWCTITAPHTTHMEPVRCGPICVNTFTASNYTFYASIMRV